MADDADHLLPERPQTGAQWGVRWHGLELMALLLGVAPVLGVMWWSGDPPIRTTAQTPWPEPTVATVTSGAWMQDLEVHLRERSPAVWALRGVHNELLGHLGLLQTEDVCVARDGWMYLRKTIAVDEPAMVAGRELRRTRLAEVKRRADALGVLLLAMPVPDKIRVYPEPLFGEGGLPAARVGFYARIMAELEAAGIPAANCLAELRTSRLREPEKMLYMRRDTHWTGAGALIAALAVTARLETPPFVEVIGPREGFKLHGPNLIESVPDLASMLGMLTEVYRDPDYGIDLVRSLSPGSRWLLEKKDHWFVTRDAGPVDPRTAPVALAGTSFSAGNGAKALQYVLGRPLDGRAIGNAAGILDRVEDVLARCERGEAATKVLVWEFVERQWTGSRWEARPGAKP